MGIKQDETVSDTKARAGKGCQLSVTHLLLGIRSERSLMCLDLCSFDDLVLELYDSGLLHSKLVRKLGAAGSSWEQLGATGSNWEQLGVDGTHWCRSAVVGPGGDPLHQLHPSRPHICASFPSSLLLVNLFSAHRGRRDFLPVPPQPPQIRDAEGRQEERGEEPPSSLPTQQQPLDLHPEHAGAAVPAL